MLACHSDHVTEAIIYSIHVFSKVSANRDRDRHTDKRRNRDRRRAEAEAQIGEQVGRTGRGRWTG